MGPRRAAIGRRTASQGCLARLPLFRRGLGNLLPQTPATMEGGGPKYTPKGIPKQINCASHQPIRGPNNSFLKQPPQWHNFLPRKATPLQGVLTTRFRGRRCTFAKVCHRNGRITTDPSGSHPSNFDYNYDYVQETHLSKTAFK